MKVLDKIKMLVAGVAVAALGAMTVVSMPSVMAVNTTSDMQQFYSSVGGASNDSTKVMDTIKAAINTIMGLLGVIAVIMIIYGGFQYMTSSGDTSKVTKAKNIIMYGIIGLVIAVLAFAIVNFVIGNLLK